MRRDLSAQSALVPEEFSVGTPPAPVGNGGSAGSVETDAPDEPPVVPPEAGGDVTDVPPLEPVDAGTGEAPAEPEAELEAGGLAGA